jgi:large subunit ribosomal protein L10
MTPQKSKEIPKKKLKEVEKLAELIKDKKTILIASIKNIPSSQFQEISKKLRGKAIIKVPKKTLIFIAIDSSGKEAVKKLKENITTSVAILFSDLDTFDLAAELVKNKSPAKAKPGQEAPEDIEVEDGPTELVPGPAISELGALGIQIQIEKGKIHIKETKVIAKKGAKISQGAADVMNKLDIKPFSIGFEPVCAFDTKEDKFYLEIKIDKEATLQELKESFNKAIAFSVEIGYSSQDTISFLIGKAASHEKALAALSGGLAEAQETKTQLDKSQEENK